MYCTIQIKVMTPTDTAYSELQKAFDHFNRELFGGTLPPCLITMQREKKTFGYFSHERWADKDNKKTDEIAMNPAMFAVVPLIEILQTMAHEQCHSWQRHFGTPGRGRYHNAEFAKKMKDIGLMPSSTGRPGGKETGDHMADYPIEGGLFLQAVDKLLTENFKITWYDRFPSKAQVLVGQESYGLKMDLPEAANHMASDEVEIVEIGTNALGEKKTFRIKYSCKCINVRAGSNAKPKKADDDTKPDKLVSFWAKPGLNVTCNECKEVFKEVG